MSQNYLDAIGGFRGLEKYLKEHCGLTLEQLRKRVTTYSATVTTLSNFSSRLSVLV